MLGRGGVARQQCLFLVLMCIWDSCEYSWLQHGLPGAAGQGPTQGQTSRIWGRGGDRERIEHPEDAAGPSAHPLPLMAQWRGGGLQLGSDDPGEKLLPP